MRLPAWISSRPSRTEREAELAAAVARAEAAEARATEATAQAEQAAEYLRMIASSPMLGIPTPGQRPPVGKDAYHWDRPFLFATPQAPGRRPLSLVTMDTLRELADTYDIIRSSIENVKRTVLSVPLEIIARDDDDDSDRTQTRIKEAKSFFDTPGGLGGEGRRRAQFEAAWIEDVLVIGALSYHYTYRRGGQLYEVQELDASTIRPRVDPYGWAGPGEKLYEQWIYGVQVADYTRDEICYDGIHAVSYSPYFKSPIEWILSPAMTALKADEWDRVWLTHGNTPSDMVALPEGYTPDQMIRFVDWFDSQNSGDSRARQQTKFVPAGSQRLTERSRKDHDFENFKLFLARRCAAVYGVHLAAIGFEDGQYAVTQEQSMDHTATYGVTAVLELREARYDEILQRLGYPELKTKNVTAIEEKASERADRLQKLLAGVMMPNEARTAEGLDPVEGGDELLVPSTLIPLSQALRPPEPVVSTDGSSSPSTDTPSSRPGQGGTPSPRRSFDLWEQKAINRLRRGKRALCDFEAEDIDQGTAQDVKRGLEVCETPAMVRALFDGWRMGESAANDREELGERWASRRLEQERSHGRPDMPMGEIGLWEDREP